jgi:carboxyl-terminal processing protease
MKLMGGAAGTTINLTIKRGNQALKFDVRRASAADRIKAIRIDPHLVYVRIPTFEGSGIAKRVNELIREHVNDATAAVILDVRDNSAGRPEETNSVADIFLDAKYLQIFQFRDGRQVAFKSKPGALSVRVIVLTNHDTASCAEMLTLALHDNHRATVIGQRTAGALFGKDVEKLDDERMVIFRSEPTVLSPTGRDYSEVGIPPDILVGELKDSGEDKVLARAIEFARTESR